MHTLFLTNPHSGRKKRATLIDKRVAMTYKGKLGEVEVQEINFEKLDRTLEEAISLGVKNIYAVGGDGTVNAIGTRLVNRAVNFGVIPTGSGNGYARNIGFSINPALAIRQTVDAWAIPVDTAYFNEVPFLNIAGVGIGAEVASRYAHTKTRGLGPYVRSSAQGILSYEPQSYRILIDEMEYGLEKILGIEVANGTQWGYEAKAAPYASLNDGLLDVVIIKNFPLIDVPGLLGKLFRGQVNASRHVEIIRGRRIRIAREQSGTAQVDGEAFAAPRHIEIGIRPRSLNLLLPNTLTLRKIMSL